MTESIFLKDIVISELSKYYKKYTDAVIHLEEHINRLYDEWIIDEKERQKELHKLDSIVKQMMKTYNNNMSNISSVTSKVLKNGRYFSKNQPDFIRIFNRISDYGTFHEEEIYFNKEREKIDAIIFNYGYKNIKKYIKFFMGSDYKIFFSDTCNEMIDVYNKIFVPLSITCKRINKKSDDKQFAIGKYESNCDGLFNNTCKISLRNYQTNDVIIFEGYVSVNSLNVIYRTFQICSPYLYSLKDDIKKKINDDIYKIDKTFAQQYLRLSNCNIFLANSHNEIIKKVCSDYKKYKNLIDKNINVLIKQFIDSDIKESYSMINLLLMGNDTMVSNASILFDILKEKKIGGDNMSDIVYTNLSFLSQCKLNRVSNSIKKEIENMKTINIENISIEKKLAANNNIPVQAKTYIIEKLGELKSGENNYKVQMAINGLINFPWKPLDAKNEFDTINKSYTESRNFLTNIITKLNNNVYGHDKSKEALVELVGKWIRNSKSNGQVIGLVGPPGTGKTLLAKSISDALGIPLSIVGLGGMNDSADLIGHSFTYAGAQYGLIVRQMIKNNNWRSVMFFDEVDKVSKRNDTNEIYNTLIHITDPNMNQHFQDRFYSSSIDFDLSGVLIVFSYNDSNKLDPILLDRIKEINVTSYSVVDKIKIAQDHIIPEICSSINIDPSKISISSPDIRYIIENYTVEAGVRELKRKIEQILLKINVDRIYLRGPFLNIIADVCRKYNDSGIEKIEELIKNKCSLDKNVESLNFDDLVDKKILDDVYNMKFENSIHIDRNLIIEYLDKPKGTVEKIHSDDMVGVINGLYATSTGVGGIVPIQISKNYFGPYDYSDNDFMHINGKNLRITGNQKKVMQESVMCALTTAINLLKPSIVSSILNKFPNGFHVHAPDGGTPKDGPSAGCAFTTAFVSILLDKKINKNIAMTGEIELTGKISKIGGLDAKLNGAKKAGVTTVFISKENEEDYELIKKKNSELFSDNFNIMIVEHIIEIVTNPSIIIGASESDFNDIYFHK